MPLRLSNVNGTLLFLDSTGRAWGAFLDSRVEHTSLLRLYDGDEKYLGDAVAYSELNGGGKIFYVCLNLLEGPHSEPLLYDVFDFIATRIGR